MISDTIPNEGKIRMYTSGWPNIQNRCCHNSGSAPAATLKKLAPHSRSNINKNRATVITGRANSSRNWVMSSIQVSTGIRKKPMPLVRMFNTVTIRLMALTSDAMPVICKPTA